MPPEIRTLLSVLHDTGATVPSGPSADVTRLDLETGPVTTAPERTSAVELQQVLGEGGMGRVYLAYEPNLERHVALKELPEELAAREGYRQAFIHEARITAGLHHPGIVPVHALTAGPEGRIAFTMQAVVGKNLSEWMDEPSHAVGTRKRLEVGLEVFLKVCDALAYAHSRGVLHCDLKPENVMVGDFGSIYLMDWGLARPLEHRVPPEPCGTPAYMAPEQARNERLDVRSDVFGLGALLFELVSGKTPYGMGSAEECIARAAAGEVADIVEASRDAGVSRRLCQIVARAVAPDPGDRYPTVMALRDDVHAFLRGGLHLPRLTFRAGAELVREGDVGNAAYLLMSGRCRVFRAADELGTPPRILVAGDIFGELALLLGGQRTASVVAIEDSTVLVIDRETIETSGALEGWSAALMVALARRFRELERRHDAR